MNHFHKQKGQSFFIDANIPHAYIHGNLDSEYLSFVNNDVHFGNVNAGSEFEESIDIQISNNIPEGTLIAINISAITGQYSTSSSANVRV